MKITRKQAILVLLGMPAAARQLKIEVEQSTSGITPYGVVWLSPRNGLVLLRKDAEDVEIISREYHGNAIPEEKP